MVEREAIPGLPGVTVERDVPCVTRDGVTLFSDVYRPDGEGPFPVVMIRIPYDKRQAENVAYSHPAWYAARGYIVVCQDCRGRYASGGEWYPFRHETDDGVDVIEWAAGLPGSSGKVGMYGFSYGGATQLLPARRRPRGLTAICPAMTGSQYYDGWTYNGGALALGFTASWAMSLGVNNAVRRQDEVAAGTYAAGFAASMNWHWFLPIGQHPPLRQPDTGYFFDWLAHPTYDDYWREWSIDEDYSLIDTAALHIAGWYDIFLGGVVKNFAGLRRHAGSAWARQNQKLVIGPWYHIPWRPLADTSHELATPGMVDDWQIGWFDRTLKGIEPAAHEAPVTLWVNGENRWRDFGDWPPPGVRNQRLHLRSGGRAYSVLGDGFLTSEAPGVEPADIYTYDPSVPAPSHGGHSCCFNFVAPMGPADQREREEWNTVLVCTSEPLERDMLVIGEPEVRLFAATTAVDTDWTARLCVVGRDGVSTNFQEGIVRSRFRESLSAPTPIKPNQVYEYRIDLGPVAIRIAKGERIRLQVSSSDFPQWERNMNTGAWPGAEGLCDAVVATQSILHDLEHPSHLILPVLEES